MTGFIIRRAIWGVVTLFIFVTIVFFLVQVLLPYDFASQFRGGGQAVRVQLGLDRPLPERYVAYLGDIVTGDLGTSFQGEPVADIVRSELPVTLMVFAVGGLLAYLLGETLGRVVAWHRNRMVSASTTTLGVLCYTTFPPFLVFLLVIFLTRPMYSARRALGLPNDSMELWKDNPITQPEVLALTAIGLLAAIVAAVAVRSYSRRVGLRWPTLVALPLFVGAVVGAILISGVGTEALDLMFRGRTGAIVGRGSPVLGLAAFVLLAFGEVMFLMRTGMAGEVSEDYVRTAQAKGLPDRLVRDRHVARNALLPVLSRLFTAVPAILAGLIIIEGQFEFGGISTRFFGAVEDADIPLIVGVLLVIGVVGLVLRFILDVVAAWLDPRIRFGAST